MTTFPIEIIVIVLTMVPAESLKEFMLVCKQWRAIIKDLKFIHDHHQFSASKGNLYLLCGPRSYQRRDSFKLICNEAPDKVVKKEIRFQFQSTCCSIVSSSYGLLCLTDSNNFGTTLHFLNPCIRICKTIYSSSIDKHRSRTDFDFLALGFGFDSQTNDYKIIRILYIARHNYYLGTDDSDYDYEVDGDYLNDETNDFDGYEIADYVTQVEVYSLSTDAWKKMQVNSFPWGMNDTISKAPIKDCVHWMVFDTQDEEMILSFDFSIEAFKEIRLPQNYKSDVTNIVAENIAVYEELLSFGIAYHNEGTEHCSLWVMKEYGLVESWMNLFTISVDERIHKPISFTKDNEIILEGENRDVLLYNCDNHKRTCLLKSSVDPDTLDFLPLTDSLDQLVDPSTGLNDGGMQIAPVEAPDVAMQPAEARDL